jgi:hypothetical protein
VQLLVEWDSLGPPSPWSGAGHHCFARNGDVTISITSKSFNGALRSSHHLATEPGVIHLEESDWPDAAEELSPTSTASWKLRRVCGLVTGS